MPISGRTTAARSDAVERSADGRVGRHSYLDSTYQRNRGPRGCCRWQRALVSGYRLVITGRRNLDLLRWNLACSSLFCFFPFPLGFLGEVSLPLRECIVRLGHSVPLSLGSKIRRTD